MMISVSVNVIQYLIYSMEGWLSLNKHTYSSKMKIQEKSIWSDMMGMGAGVVYEGVSSVHVQYKVV